MHENEKTKVEIDRHGQERRKWKASKERDLECGVGFAEQYIYIYIFCRRQKTREIKEINVGAGINTGDLSLPFHCADLREGVRANNVVVMLGTELLHFL